MSTARDDNELIAQALRFFSVSHAWPKAMRDRAALLAKAFTQPGEGALTGEQLVEGFTKTALASLNYGDWFDAGARFAERHHGITIPQTGDSNG